MRAAAAFLDAANAVQIDTDLTTTAQLTAFDCTRSRLQKVLATPVIPAAGAVDDSKDAARYRWLRDKSEPGICAFYLSVGKVFTGVKVNQAYVDATIDAAISAQQGPEGKK